MSVLGRLLCATCGFSTALAREFEAHRCPSKLNLAGVEVHAALLAELVRRDGKSLNFQREAS